MVDSSQIPYAIAIDFDGILCQNAYPDIGDPNWDTIHQALKEQSNGAKLILWTCREGRSLERAVAACTGWGLTFDAVNENLPEWRKAYRTDPRKVGANEYWDDRNVINDNENPLFFSCPPVRRGPCGMGGAPSTLGAILTIAALAAIGAFGYLLCWKAGEADDRAEQEQIERMNRKEKHK